MMTACNYLPIEAMHDRLLNILLTALNNYSEATPVYLWFTPKLNKWDISEKPTFDRRYSKVILIDRTNAEQSISDFLYQQQPPHQEQ